MNPPLSYLKQQWLTIYEQQHEPLIYQTLKSNGGQYNNNKMNLPSVKP